MPNQVLTIAPLQQKRRLHTTIQYSSGNTKPEKLQKGLVIRRLLLRLKGTITVAAADNVKANWDRGGEWALIKTLKIIVNSNQVIRQFTGYDLFLFHFLTMMRRPHISPLIGSGVVLAKTDTTPHFDSVICIPFSDPWSIKPLDTALNTSDYNDIRIEVEWNAIANVCGGTTGSTDASATLDVHADEFEAPAGSDYASDSGSFLPTTIRPVYQSGNGATDVTFDLGTGPSCRGLLINLSTTASSRTTDKPDIATNLKLTRGPETIIDQPAQVIYQDGWRRHGFLFNDALNRPSAITGSGFPPVNTVTAQADQGGYANLTMSELSDLRASYWIDLCPDGYFTEAIATQGLPDFKLIVSTNATVDVAVFPWFLYSAQR